VKNLSGWVNFGLKSNLQNQIKYKWWKLSKLEGSDNHKVCNSNLHLLWKCFWKGGAIQLMANYNLSSKWSSWNFASYNGVDRLLCHLLTFIIMNYTPSIVVPCTKFQDSHGGTQQGDAQKSFNIRYGQGWQGANGTPKELHTHIHKKN
jgi:hypothetical protein